MSRIVLLLLLALPAAAWGQVPSTPRRPVTDSLHGEQVVDPYRWLEGDAQGRPTPEVAAWTEQQNAWTREVLDGAPGRAALEARLTELLRVGSVGTPVDAGERVFYTRRDGDQEQASLYVRRGDGGEPRVLVDPTQVDASGLVSLDWYSPNHDGALLAFGLSRAGDEDTTLHLLDVGTGRWRADELRGKAGSVSWLPDGSGFLYSRLKDSKDPYSRQVCFHVLGDHQREDRVLFEQHDQTWGPFAWLSRDARWLLYGYWTGTRSNDLWVVDFARWRKDGSLERKEIVVGESARAQGLVVGDTLYMRTTLEAPAGRVVAVDLREPARGSWREVVAEQQGAALRGVSRAGDLLALTYLEDASTRIHLRPLERPEADPRVLDLPGIGSAHLSTHPERSAAWLSFSSFATPRSIYRVDLASGKSTLWERAQVPVDPEAIEVRRVHYESKDGTSVGMFLVHRKGLKLDGQRPTLLYGYGGFNISMTPRFEATLAPWLEAGGVYALANLRGGGEGGDAWHRAGQLERKQAVFDDFVAAAEFLVAEGYTSPARLGIAGGSNGGLLTGAVLTQRPELFGAVLSQVPLLDMLRFHRFLMARFWVPEYGSAEDPAQFRFLRRYSPYHQVKRGVRYPAVFLTAGENDSRVHPLHARKMAAALQWATASDPAKRPVLLWVEGEAGHGRGKPLRLRVRAATDRYTFLMSQLGVWPAGGVEAEAEPPVAAEAGGSGLEHVQAGQRWVFRHAAGADVEVVWTVLAVEGEEVRYSLTTRVAGKTLGEGTASTWRSPAAPLPDPEVEVIEAAGIRFRCAVLTTGDARTYVPLDARGRLTFPPLVRQRKGEQLAVDLVRVE